MKNLILSLSLALITFGISSCNVDDNGSQTYQAMANVVIGGANPLLQTDNGTSLYCTNAITDTTYKMTTGDRVFIYYTFGDTSSISNHVFYPITLSAYTKATIKDFVTVQPDVADPYANKSLMGINMVGVSGNYLNAVFCAFMSVSDQNTYELIRMKKYENNTTQDAAPHIYFELRHNTNYVNTSYYNLKAFSFNLSSLYKEFPSATRFNINLKWIAGNNESSSDIVYIPQK